MKVFISTSSFSEYDRAPLDLLERAGLSYSLNPYRRKLNENEVIHILSEDSYIGLIAGLEPLTENALRKAHSLKTISRVGVGLDNVNLEIAKELNIKVFNTPAVLDDAVAELTLGLILSCLRKISLHDREIRSGVWQKHMGQLFKGKTLGIIGLGRIGLRVAQLAQGFGVRVIFSDIRESACRDFSQVSLKELLSESDIVSIHISSGDEIISVREIDMMKKGAVLINTARGSVINEQSLCAGLATGHIGAAGLDTFTEEPYRGPLKDFDQVIMTAHIGSYAREARNAMEKMAVENLLIGLKEEGLIS